MATKTTDEVNHDRIANAIRYLSYAKSYYPLEYGFFTKSLATRGATESMEDSNYILALYDFESYFSEFLRKHPGVEQDINRLSPKEMVDLVDTELIEKTRTRREAARKIAERAVTNAVKQGKTVLNEAEIVEAARSSAIEAESPAAFQRLMEVRAPAAAAALTEITKEDPLAIQKLLFGDPESTRVIVDRVVFSPLPNKRALHTAITSLPMAPNETRDVFLARAEAVTKTAMVLSSDLSQTPVVRATPGGLMEALLSIQKDRRAAGALAAFNKLTEQAKNAVSLAVVAKAWEGAVDVITRRAGGAITPALVEVIKQGNTQFGTSMREPLEKVGLLVGDVINPLLGRTFADLIELGALNRSLPRERKLFPDKAGVSPATPQELFLLAAYSWKPEGVWFEERRVEGSVAPAGWVMHWATDSALGRLMDSAAKSEAAKGFFGKVLGLFGIKLGAKAAVTKVAGEGVKRGVAAALTKLGLSALAGVFTGGTSLLAQAAIWVGGKVLGGLWKAGAWFLSARWLTSLLGFGAPSAPKRWYEQDWVPIVAIVAVVVLIPMFGAIMQITTQNAALIEGSYGEPDRFVEDPIIYPPPDYLDINALQSKSFPCLFYGAGVSTQQGATRSLLSTEKTIIENTINNNPAIKALSCALDCPNRSVNISAFSEGDTYVGYAPSALAGNIVFYPRMFGGFSEQSRARLLAHELAHNIDWLGGGLAEGYYPLSCGPTGKYPWKETPEEAFATAVELYIIGNPFIRDFCGGRAYEYFGKTVAQCK